MHVYVAKSELRVPGKHHFDSIWTSKSARMHVYVAEIEMLMIVDPILTPKKHQNACMCCENDISGAPKAPF